MNVQDEVEREVRGGNGITTVRTITVKDSSGSIPVTLWSGKSGSPIKTGDRVKFAHMSPKKDTYRNCTVLHSTQHTKIEVCEWK